MALCFLFDLFEFKNTCGYGNGRLLLEYKYKSCMLLSCSQDIYSAEKSGAINFSLSSFVEMEKISIGERERDGVAALLRSCC